MTANDYAREFPGYDVREATSYGEAIEAVLRGGGEVEAQALEEPHKGYRMRLGRHQLKDGHDEAPDFHSSDADLTWLILTKQQAKCPTCGGAPTVSGGACDDCHNQPDGAYRARPGTVLWAFAWATAGWNVQNEKWAVKGCLPAGLIDWGPAARRHPTGWSRRKLDGK